MTMAKRITGSELWIKHDTDQRRRLSKSQYGKAWITQTIRLAGDPYAGALFEYKTKAEAVKKLKADGFKKWP